MERTMHVNWTQEQERRLFGDSSEGKRTSTATAHKRGGATVRTDLTIAREEVGKLDSVDALPSYARKLLREVLLSKTTDPGLVSVTDEGQGYRYPNAEKFCALRIQLLTYMYRTGATSRDDRVKVARAACKLSEAQADEIVRRVAKAVAQRIEDAAKMDVPYGRTVDARLALIRLSYGDSIADKIVSEVKAETQGDPVLTEQALAYLLSATGYEEVPWQASYAAGRAQKTLQEARLTFVHATPDVEPEHVEAIGDIPDRWGDIERSLYLTDISKKRFEYSEGLDDVPTPEYGRVALTRVNDDDAHKCNPAFVAGIAGTGITYRRRAV